MRVRNLSDGAETHISMENSNPSLRLPHDSLDCARASVGPVVVQRRRWTETTRSFVSLMFVLGFGASGSALPVLALPFQSGLRWFLGVVTFARVNDESGRFMGTCGRADRSDSVSKSHSRVEHMF